MKKLGAFVVTAGLVAGGWFVVREKLARDNAGDYISKREIPTYHWMSFHSADDRNVLGYCTPCGAKARDVLKEKIDAKIDALDKAVNGKK